MFLPPDFIPPPPKEAEPDNSTLAAKFANSRTVKPLPWQIPEMFFVGGPPVADSEELQRILALPRRQPPTEAEQKVMAEAMTNRLKRHRAPGECKCDTWGRPCIKSLNEVQGWALTELSQPDNEGRHGILGGIGVGKGKCLNTGEFLDYSTGYRRSISDVGALQVASLKEEFTVKDATCFNSGEKECVQVTLGDGTSIIASNDHPYLTQRGWVKAAELTCNDLVSCVTEMPEPIKYDIVDDSEVILAAYLLSDGGCSQNTIGFTNMTPAIIAECETVAKSNGFGWKEVASKSKAKQFSLLHPKGSSANAYRAKWNLYGLAKEKRLHPRLWGLPKNQIALFLNRFWACDGHVSDQGVECTLASEAMIDDLVFLFSRLGVRASKKLANKKLKGKEFKAWRITAFGAQAKRFIETVGLILGKETQSLTLLERLSSLKRNTNRDIVPIGRSEIKEIALETGIAKSSLRDWFQATQGQFISRSKFASFCEKYAYSGKFAWMKNVRWEKVKAVICKGMLPVWDLTVPDTHNFVVNGAVVHNTILALLSPMVTPWTVTALLVPPTLIPQLIQNYQALAEHFIVPTIIVPASGKTKAFSQYHAGRPTLHVLPYSKLSRAAATAYLATLKPDAVIADEAHKLKNADAVGTGRFLSLYDQVPTADHIPQSGSLTARFLGDYAHLSGLALRSGSPLPLEPDVVTDWDRVLGANDIPADMGALSQLCKPGEDVRAAFQRRLRETPRVIITDSPGCNASLVLLDRPLDVPKVVTEAIDRCLMDWVRPDGEEFIERLQVDECASQLASGFYYRHKFPRGEPPPLIEEWREKRKDWHKELRQVLQGPRRPYLDSPLLLKQAAIRYYNGNYKGDLPVWRSETWLAWRDIKDQVQPEQDIQWLDDFLLQDAAEWARKHRGVIWTAHRAFEARLAEMTGLPRYGAGSGESILKEKGDKSIIASIKAHGTGRDGLQYLYNDQYLVEFPENGTALDQCLDSKTEILTQSGWVGIDDKWDDQVAAFNKETGVIEWQTGNRVERLLGSEKMYGIENPHLDIRVTAGHRMLVEKHRRKGNGGCDGAYFEPLEFFTADKLPKKGRLPLAGNQDASGVPLTHDELVFIGMFMTDGCRVGNDIVLIQSDRYPAMVNLFEQTILDCGFDFTKRTITTPTNFGPRNHPCHQWRVCKFRPRSGGRGWCELEKYLTKELSPYLENMTKEQLQSLLLGMWAGDGGKTEGTYDYGKYTCQTMNICSKRKYVLDKLQSLCVRRGMRAVVTQSTPNMWFIRISNYDRWSIQTYAGDKRPKWEEKQASATERVWCASVPFGAIVTRRNGKVAIVGNCLGRLHRVGQANPEVTAWIARHTADRRKLLTGALRDAKYSNETMGAPRQLLICDCGFDLE